MSVTFGSATSRRCIEPGWPGWTAMAFIEPPVSRKPSSLPALSEPLSGVRPRPGLLLAPASLPLRSQPFSPEAYTDRHDGLSPSAKREGGESEHTGHVSGRHVRLARERLD